MFIVQGSDSRTTANVSFIYSRNWGGHAGNVPSIIQTPCCICFSAVWLCAYRGRAWLLLPGSLWIMIQPSLTEVDMEYQLVFKLGQVVHYSFIFVCSSEMKTQKMHFSNVFYFSDDISWAAKQWFLFDLLGHMSITFLLRLYSSAPNQAAANTYGNFFFLFGTIIYLELFIWDFKIQKGNTCS